ncbi:MAG: hypothetical protein GY751_06405 [Bacteroidetes bacterium]|nr:hypothetical protein [Bacteroidota bacterium]
MFFVRCYRKGAAKSGTTNVAEWEKCPDLNTFYQTCEGNGEGKYLLFERGKGIRGMRKVNEYIVETGPQQVHNGRNSPNMSELLVFAAEEFAGETNIAVKKNMGTSDLSDEELWGVFEQVANKKVSGAEEFETFTKDIKSLLNEVKKRGMSSEGYSEAVATKESETKGGLLSGGTGFAAGLVVGGLGGVAATATYYRKQLTDMEERFGALEASLAETEKTLKKESEERVKEKKAEQAVKAFDNRLNLDASFLSNFNGNNGPHY